MLNVDNLLLVAYLYRNILLKIIDVDSTYLFIPILFIIILYQQGARWKLI